MKEFKKGDRVLHPLHGCGTVMEVRPPESGSEVSGFCAVVDFDNKVHQTFALEYAPLKLLALEEITRENAALAEWRRLQNETFIKDADGTEHSLGSHWTPFMSDAKEIIKRLPEITRKSMLMSWFAENEVNMPPYAVPEDWAKAFYLAWPQRERGLLMALEPRPDGNHLVSLSPYVGLGNSIEHAITIKRVLVWESGLEAQIEARVGEAEICFYDSLFACNRGWYITGKQYQFALAGIAYTCVRAKDDIIKAPLYPEVTKAMKDRPEWASSIAAEEMELHTKGMALFIPVENWEKDDYEFRGTIKAVTQLEMLEQRCWRVRTVIMRDGDNDIDLDIIVTEKVWGGDTPPAVGEDMKGTLWLQGELWNAERYRIVGPVKNK